MARGRMINNCITRDKKINDLSDDTSRLAFTWLITFADRDGRVEGDPALVRSLLFPRRTDITIEQIETYIGEWAYSGLILWYEAEGDKWITFCRFEENQIGMRKDREPESNIPNFNAETCRRLSGSMPEGFRKDGGLKEQNRREQNRTELEEEGENPQNVFGVYQQEIGALTPAIKDKLIDLETEHPANWVIAAIKLASVNNARSFPYFKAILDRWKVEGYGSEFKSRASPNRNEPAGFPGIRDWLISKGELADVGGI